ncbi:hypothetical protein ACLB1O_15110 [Escherichia coli]
MVPGVTSGSVLTTQAQRAGRTRRRISGGTEPSAFPDTLPGYTRIWPGQRHPLCLYRVADARPGIPGEFTCSAAPLVRYGWTPRGELAVVYDRSGEQVRVCTMMNAGAGWWRTVYAWRTGPAGNRLPLRQRRQVTNGLVPGQLELTRMSIEKDHITITDSLDRRVKCCTPAGRSRAEAGGGEKGTRGRQRHAESV